MQIFVYEYATSGGIDDATEDVALRRALLEEGEAMRRAVTADLAAGGFGVLSLLDAAEPQRGGDQARLETRAAAFEQRVGRADGVLLIAPEVNGILTRLAAQVAKLGGRLLSPDPSFAALASDKHETAQRLRAHGVAAPEGWLIAAHCAAPRPAPGALVRKRVDGAGSMDVQWVEERGSLPPWPVASRVEVHCPGLPTSVALLCGPGGTYALPACRQWISADGHFTYLGGSLPLEGPLDQRARSLAVSALQALPETQGYVGVDLVLGASDDGRQDVVLEINPRLTTSYVGLRQAASSNLAVAMVRAAQGQAVSLEFSTAALRFTPLQVTADDPRPQETHQTWIG